MRMIRHYATLPLLACTLLFSSCTSGAAPAVAARATTAPLAPIVLAESAAPSAAPPVRSPDVAPERTAVAAAPAPTSQQAARPSAAAPNLTPVQPPGDVLARECSGTRLDRVALCIPLRDHTPPVLVNLMVGFSPVDPVSGRGGPFVFNRAATRVVEEFGLPQSGPQGAKTSTALGYPLLAADAQILAPIAGVVTRHEYQRESDDWELELRPSAISDWSVSLDHIRDASLNVSDLVAAGQPVGRPSYGIPGYRTLPELQVNEEIIDPLSTFEHRVRTKQVVHCAVRFVGPAVRAGLARLMDDWEAFLGRTVYTRSAMPVLGCLQLQL